MLPFLRGKVAIALIGACLIGGTTAFVVAKSVSSALTAAPQTTTSQNSNTTSSPTSTSISTATHSASATATTDSSGGGGGGGDGGQPTATPFIFPTFAPRPTPTTPAAGQPCNIDGRIVGIGASTFTLHHNGVSYTIVVDSSTSFTGSATSFSGLQIDMDAQVGGTTQSDGSCLASTVNTSAGDT